MPHPDDKLTAHLYRSFDAMFGTTVTDGGPVNLRAYPKGDEQIQADQDAWERNQDRDEYMTRDEIDSDDAGIPCRGEI